MQIDRSKFFALTTAITAAVVGAMAGTAGCSSTKTDGADASTSPDGGGGGGGGGGDGGGNSDAATDGGACLGNTGMASCSDEDGGTVGPDCDTVCSGVLENFTAGVAAEIAPCVLSLPTCEGAGTAIAACSQKAVAKACPDTTVAAYCQGLATTCADAGADVLSKCQAFAPALSTAGRTNFTACVTESECFQSIDTCIGMLEGAPTN